LDCTELPHTTCIQPAVGILPASYHHMGKAMIN